MEKHTFCQSCGMPLTQDPKGGGTNAHGTRSHTYCSYCFREGKFLNPDMTLDEMKEVVVTALHKKGMPTFAARLVAGNLHRMERWRSAG